MNNNMISILIPTFKRTHLLKWNLDSIFKNNKLNYNYEIIILNEGREEIELNQLLEYYKGKLNVKYIHSAKTKKDIEDWRIPGFAFNIGSKISKGNILVLCCAEIYHIGNTIDNIFLNFETNKMIIPEGKDDNGKILEKIQNDNYIFNLIEYYNMKSLSTRLPFCMGISKEKYFELNGYDEDMIGIWYDDVNFVERMQLAGCNYYQIDNKIIHLYHPRIDDLKHTEPRLVYNKKIYEMKKGKIKANENREWGVF